MGDSIMKDSFNVSINILSATARIIISTLLNPPKFIPTKENLLRNWLGLADLLGYSSEEISLFRLSKDPTNSILQKWATCEDSTVTKFLCCLQKMDRFDVIADIFDIIISDIATRERGIRNNVDTSLFITNKDYECHRRGIQPIQYDASILYASEDVDFAYDIVTHLEEKCEMDIFVPERDLIVGIMEQSATMRIIASRCGKLITVLSPAFLESNVNNYFLSFAQSLAVEHRVRKIIPIIYKPCDIPAELKPMHKLALKSAWPGNFFQKLQTAIQNQCLPQNSINSVAKELPSTSLHQSSYYKSDKRTNVEETNNKKPEVEAQTSKKKLSVVEKVVPNMTKFMNRIKIKKKKPKKKEAVLELAS